MGSKSQTRIENINALAELERVGWKYEPSGDNELRMCCPVHDDQDPSLNLNVKKNLFICHGCKATGDVITLLAHISKVERSVMIVELSKRYDISGLKVINPATVEKFHKKIWEAGPLLQALYERGLTKSDIREHRIGFHDGRLTIPVYDESENVVNIRRYLPGAPGSEKMKNTPGYGDARIFMPNQLKYDTVWLCGGECKSIVAKRLLNKEGVGAVCLTAGEGEWKPEHTEKFKGKRVYICFDVDKAGVSGHQRIGAHLFYAAQSVHIIKLPLDINKYPKGDINDYVGKEGAGTAELLDLMLKAEKFVPPQVEEESEPDKAGDPVKLVHATSADNMGRRIQIEAVVAAMDTTPFLVPKVVAVNCDKKQANCPWCPVKPKEVDPDTGYVKLTVKGTSPGILEMVNAPKDKQREATRIALGIPECKIVAFAVKEHYNVTDIRLVSQLTIGQESSEHATQPVPAYCVSSVPELNVPYIFDGRVFPNPRNQQAILLLDKMQQAEDNLTSFAPTDGELDTLTAFTPKTWTVEGIQEKLDDIYSDFEANVTRIFARRDLHLVLDLCYHSVLLFPFDGQVTKGWTNVLVAGDSAQGKSEASSRLMSHYGLGERIECKNATPAGLLGGLQQLGNRWFVSWGIIPTHDRRLVFLEEVKGTSVDVLSKLTDMRSSGIAEIPKIEKRRAHARTRLCFISNPRSDRPVSAYNFGIEAIKELIGGLEDIRRFDLAIIVSSAQIDPAEINRLSTSRPQRPHIYTGELCRRNVLWAWTRKPQQVCFESDAITAILEYATDLCSKYSEALPLVDRGTMRHKIARLAAALAARTFSYGKTKDDLLVRKCHVDYIYGFINKVYSDSVFGYADFSRAQVHANQILDPKAVERCLRGTRYPADLVKHILYADEITLNDICDWCEVDRDGAQSILSLLVRKNALYRVKRSYVKTSDFIVMLKRLEQSGIKQTESSGKEQEF